MKTSRHFQTLLETQWSQGHFTCVGLDGELDKIPPCIHQRTSQGTLDVAETLFSFNRALIEATHDLVGAYKPNAAFYEAYGLEGIMALQKTISFIHTIAPQVPVILDAKRADIGNTNHGYVTAAFDFLQADAITLHPYLGQEALQPFLNRAEKGIIILCKTSNPGSGEFQNLIVDGEALYLRVARHVAQDWNSHHNCGLVVGATYPEELRAVRTIVGSMPLLIPGIGAQGGSVEKVVAAAQDAKGKGMLISSSRAIIFASFEKDFAEAARTELEKLHNLISANLPLAERR